MDIKGFITLGRSLYLNPCFLDNCWAIIEKKTLKNEIRTITKKRSRANTIRNYGFVIYGKWTDCIVS